VHQLDNKVCDITDPQCNHEEEDFTIKHNLQICYGSAVHLYNILPSVTGS